MIRPIGPEDARAALMRWPGDPDSLELVGHSGASVYRFTDGVASRVLRLYDPRHRTAEQHASEMAFLEHLASHGMQVAAPVRSRAGRTVERIGEWSASVQRWASGEIVRPGSPHWGAAVVRAWGRTLASIHRASRSFDAPSRWSWEEEDLIAGADALFPREDDEPRRALREVTTRLDALPRDAHVFGVIHHDHGPQNFHWDPAGGITSFDFGNACRHWFAMDVVIALSTLRREPDRERMKEWLLEGYAELDTLDPRVWREAGTFLRLRLLYVYLSRLQMFGASPDAEQSRTLATLRELVLDGAGWFDRD